MKECNDCGFLNEFGYCECPSSHKWYACPIENQKPENILAMKEYAEHLNISFDEASMESEVEE